MASYVQQHSAFVSSQIANAIGHGSGCRAPATLDDLDGVMMQVQGQLQPIVPNSSMLKPKPWQDETLRGTLSTAWRHLHQARAENGKGLRSLFNAWRHAYQFLKLIASTRKHCRRLRRARLVSFLNEAQEQANMRSIHGVFKVINKLAPRNLQRPQIRHTDGTLMDAEQESQATAAYLQEVYQDHSKSSFQTDLQAGGIPFTCEELQESISAIPARKAGPRHLACNVLYKHSAASVAPLVGWWSSLRAPTFQRRVAYHAPQAGPRVQKPVGPSTDWTITSAGQEHTSSSSQQDYAVCQNIYGQCSAMGVHAGQRGL